MTHRNISVVEIHWKLSDSFSCQNIKLILSYLKKKKIIYIFIFHHISQFCFKIKYVLFTIDQNDLNEGG